MPLHHCELCHIDLDRITVRRGGQTLLQDVSMHIHCGQLTVLIGCSRMCPCISIADSSLS